MSFHTIFSAAREHPSKHAVVHNGSVISYAAFACAIGATMDILESEQLSDEHTIVVLVHDLLDCWVVVLALQALGLNTVSVSSTAVLETLGINPVTAIVTTQREVSKHQLGPAPGKGSRLVVIPDPVYGTGGLPEWRHSHQSRKVGGHLLYTSGTTGKYKKIVLQGDLQQRRNAQRIESNPYCGADTVYHCIDFGLWTALGYRNPLATWQLTGCVILDQRKDWHQHFLHSGMTHATLIPDKVQQLLTFLNERPAVRPTQDFHLLVAGGFISRKLAGQVLARVTWNLENAYASTEMHVLMLRSLVTNLDELHWLTPSADRTVEIVDDVGIPCPVEVEGQLRVRLTQLDCCAYVDDPQASEKVFRSGYFYPGDTAVRRADGRICILGRSADVINYRGQKLSVAPLEQEIQHRLGVNAVCLFSGLNRRGDVEVVMALESDQLPQPSDLQALNREFAQFDHIQYRLFRQFPRTQTGTSKIDRIALRKLIFSGHGQSE